MIVLNTLDGDILVPLKGNERARCVDLVPGYNDISDEDWALARDYVLDKIEKEIIKEEWAKVDKAEAEKYLIAVASEDARESNKVRVPARITDIDHRGNRIRTVISQTYNPKYLEAWMAQETRPDMRMDMQKQIDAIAKGELMGEKKV